MYFECFILYNSILYIMNENIVNAEETLNKEYSKDNSKEKILKKYFIPPNTMQLMKWGQTITILILFGLMFIGVLYSYVYSNYTDYQNRISVISHANLFGKDPEEEFKKYMNNSQTELLNAVMKDIQNAGTDLETVGSRLDSSTSRLVNEVETDVPEKYAEANSLGISIQKNIASLRDSMSKLAGTFVLGNYVQDGVVNTVQ